MSSEKSILFPVILACIALVVWVVASFLGFVYTGVNVFVGVIFVIAILLLMGLGLWMLLRSNLVSDTTSHRKKQTRLAGWILFVLGAVVSLYFLNHFMRVWIDQKPQVKTAADAQLDELDTTFSTDPSVENSFALFFDEQQNYMDIYLRGTGMDRSDRDMKIANWKQGILNHKADSLDANSTYPLTQAEVLQTVDECKSAIESWNPFTIIASLEELAANKARWEDYSRHFMDGNGFSKDSFEPVSDHNGNLAGLIKTPGFGTNWQAIALVILLMVLMLLPVLLTMQLASGGRRAKGISTI